MVSERSEDGHGGAYSPHVISLAYHYQLQGTQSVLTCSIGSEPTELNKNVSHCIVFVEDLLATKLPRDN